MEARSQWELLEPKLAKAEQAGHQLTEAAKQQLHDAVQELKAFKVAFAKQRRAQKKKS